MAMAKFTVDGPNLLLIAKAGVTDVNVKTDLYSDAKEHWLTTADSKFDFPFRTIAGDFLGGVKYFGDGYFIRNGWKIRPCEEDHTFTIDGNLFLDEGEPPGIVVPTLGDFTVLSIIERSTDPREREVSAATLATMSAQFASDFRAETFDGVTFDDVMQDLLAMANARIVESPSGTFTFYERDNVTPRYTLTRAGTERTRS